MNIRTLDQIRAERGEEPHGFVLMACGALPADQERARHICARIQEAIDFTVNELEKRHPGLEVILFTLRMESFEKYIEANMPQAK